MSKFFRSLFCCSGAGATSPVATNQTRSSRNTNPARTHQHPQNLANGNTERRRNPHPKPEKKPEKKFLKIKSSHTSQEVRHSDIQMKDDRELKFNCPICFRFFDRILVGSCCYNYLCHFCAEDVDERVKKDDKVLVARCPFCDSDDFVLYDVDIKEKPKKYTDSFYSTIKSAGKGNFKSKLFMNNNNEDDLHASNVDGISPNPDADLKDRRSASDGMIYLQKEMLEIKANRTVGTNPEEDVDFNFGQVDNVLNNQSGVKLEYSYVSQNNSGVKQNKAQIEEEIRNADSDDSLNQRDPNPIEVIPEDEFESSIVPDTAKQQQEVQF